MIKKVKFVSIPVTDQVRALEFYTEKLGFTVHTDAPMGDWRWIELTIPGAETGLTITPANPNSIAVGSWMNLCLDTADINATYEELKAKGVEFTEPPTAQPWGTFAMFKDPDGNTFVLSQSED